MTRILHCLTSIFGVLLLSCPASAQPAAGGKVVFEVTDSLHTPLAYATIALKAHADGKMYAATTGLDGKCVFTLPADMYDAGITFVGYEPRHMSVAAVEARDQYHTVRLRIASVSIQDVVVTASESKGVTSSSVIDRKAMEHIQPSSFADLLALLPGGSSSSPVLSAPNTIHLREIGISNDDYATSSLGTSFVIDGAPMRNDANMQYIPGADQLLERKLFINKGVDMRSISTDEIQHVEIVRGIPSVEYGDLTSGLVKIERKRGGKALTARFKADMDSKLFSVGKGFEIPDRGLTVNIGADLLDSKADPRNKLENYKRMTGSLRIHKTWDASPDHTLALGTNLDYTGSFDNRKVDPESNNGNLDDFKSKYNRFALSVGFDYTSKKEGFFRSFEATASVDYSRDRIERRKFMQVTRPTAVPNSLAPGEHDAQFLEASYIADLTVDGQPLNAYAKALATFGVKTAATSSTIVAGADWALDKNLGRGQVYDMLHPLSSDAATRPRAYSDIPAQHDLGLFVEDNTTVALGRSRLEVMAGVRATTMLNLSREYALHGRFYFDPRFNARFAFPVLKLGRRTLETAVSGGVGWHTKTPTMDQLYPAPLYYDFQQLNYYHANPAFRRINMVTYVVDPTNYSLGAARNFKWEVRGDVTLDGNRFSLTYFEEDMKSGFRTANRYASYTRKQYDYSGVDDSQLEGPPSLEGMPYTVDTLVRAAGVATNGQPHPQAGRRIHLLLAAHRVPAHPADGHRSLVPHRIRQQRPGIRKSRDGHQRQAVCLHRDLCFRRQLHSGDVAYQFHGRHRHSPPGARLLVHVPVPVALPAVQRRQEQPPVRLFRPRRGRPRLHRRIGRRSLPQVARPLLQPGGLPLGKHSFLHDYQPESHQKALPREGDGGHVHYADVQLHAELQDRRRARTPPCIPLFRNGS